MDMLNTKDHQFHFNKVIDHFHGLDILVNNAGRSQRAKWTQIDLSVDKDVFDLDVFSVINLTRIAVRYFESNNQIGHVAVTSSTAGLIGVTNSASYCGAKFAIHVKKTINSLFLLKKTYIFSFHYYAGLL